MDDNKPNKSGKRPKEPVYKCEICQGIEPDKPVVACDKCDKWYHFVCVGITSIGRRDSWICAVCNISEIFETSTSQQSISIVVKQKNKTPPSNNSTNATPPSNTTIVKPKNSTPPPNNSKETTTPSNPRTESMHGSFNTSISGNNDRNRTSQQDRLSTTTASHRSRISRTSSMTSSRRRIQLELIEEERNLQEQRDTRYLQQKFKILMDREDGEKRTDDNSRSSYVRSWVESQRHDKQPSQQADHQTSEKFKTTAKRTESSIKSKQTKIATQDRSTSKSIGLNNCDVCHMVGEETSFVKCCLCAKKGHHVCMDIMYIDQELNWICCECKEPKFQSNEYEGKTNWSMRSLGDISSTKFTTFKPKLFSPITNEEPNASLPVCMECGIIDDRQPFIACNICGKLFHILCIKKTIINNNVLWVCIKCLRIESNSRKDIENNKKYQFPPSLVDQDQIISSTNMPRSNLYQPQLPIEQHVMKPSSHESCGLTSAQIASRHVVTKDLPIFVGKPEQWPMFLSRFNNSTTLCGYSDSENLDRLQKCLKGNAYDAVKSRLLTAESVPDIIETLRMLYGRPELIVNALMKKIRNEPPPKAEKLNTLVDYALSVKNVCATLEQAKLVHHLSNPSLVQELVEKLPTNIKIEWAKHKATIEDITLSTLGEFLYDLAKVVSTVTEPTPPKESNEKQNSKKDSERSNKQDDWGDSKSQNWRKDSENSNIHRVSQSNKGTLLSHSTEKPNNSTSKSCVICQNKCEKLEVCSLFISHDVDQRWKDVYNNKLCRKCLNRHGRNCSSTKICGVNGCMYKHHALLHDEKKHSKPSTSNKQETTEKSVHHAHSTFDRNVLLRIALVNIYFKERKIQTFAYLDDGSDVTLISERLVKAMEIEGVKKPLCLFWTSDIHRKEKGSQLVNLEISGRDESTQRYQLNGIRTVENLALPSQSLIAKQLQEKFPYLRQAELMNYIDAIPEILIGSDNASLNAQQKLVEGEINQPIASLCRLGWTINGRIDNKYPNKVIVNPHVKLCPYYSQADEDLHQQVKDHFTVENFGVLVKNSLNLCSKEDERALELLNKFTKRTNDRYETSLLWKYDSFDLPASYPMALKRLLCVEKHKPQVIKHINDIIIDYLNKGYVSKLTNSQIQEVNPKIWYLPIFVVTNQKKPDKIRMVFDGAAKVNGTSLNSFLLKGPDQLGSLVDILRRFREKAVAATGDIKEMFHQVVIRDEDKQAQRFLWRNGEARDPDQYVMNVMTFGATCSPSTAQFIKNLNANEHQKEYPRAVEAIVHNHYVDDMLECEHDEVQMIQLIKDVKHIHSRAGFEIRNFSSNAKKVMQQFGEIKGGNGKSINLDTSLGTERVLGMWWNIEYDYFTFSLKYTNIKEAILKGEKMPTKREVLKTLMSVFDPLGLISHYLVHLKILLQDIWRSGMTWDEEISSEVMKTSWSKWIHLLPKVEELRLARLYSTKLSPGVPTSIELHTFVDASEHAYSAVTFVRVEDATGVDCSLIGSKTRVAPMKYLSIPRLELQGGILGTRLLSSIGEAQRFNVIRRVIWTDSFTVLSWIRSDQRKYHQFVAHRIGEILESTDQTEWRWIPSKLNVADDATKWTKNINFKSSNRWYKGPEFLKLSEEHWPQQPSEIQPDTTEEIKFHFVHLELHVPTLVNSANFSNWNRMIRALAYARRYIFILRAKVQKKVVQHTPFSREELIFARNLLIRQAQFECYPEEMVILQHNQLHPNEVQRDISNRSPIFNCSPYIDENGILRIRGRIDLAPGVSEDVKRPIILPAHNRITRLLVLCYHKMYHHRNHNTVINEIQQKFYISRLRQVLKSVRVDECQLCTVRNARPAIPEMADLPLARLAIGFRVFSYIGIDYFGPMTIVIGRRTEKRWGVLITCLTVRAIHIEIVPSLDTDSCIICIRNFVNTRGPVREIYSDQGTNFKGMDNELNRLIAAIDVNKMATEFNSLYTQWHFNPPLSPWMGGCWERLIRSVKTSLYEILPERHPTEFVLRSILLEIQNVVNSRPLTFISLEHEDDEALTPNHFLFGSSSGLKPMVPLETDGPILRSKWKENQRLTDLFWARFIKEYLPTLTCRTKWFKVKPIDVGDIVLVIDEENIRNTYPRAKVLETIVGSNGQVRRAKIQKGDKNKTILWRSAQNLARLDVHEKQSMDSLATDPMSNQTGRSVMNGNTSQDIELNEDNADSGQRMSKSISENNLTTNGDSTFE